MVNRACRQTASLTAAIHVKPLTAGLKIHILLDNLLLSHKICFVTAAFKNIDTKCLYSQTNVGNVNV